MEISMMSRRELKETASLAAEAFNNYCYFTLYFPHSDERKAVMNSIIEHEYRTNFGKALYIVAKNESGRIIASAQLNPPTYKKPSDLSYALHGWLSVYKTGDRQRIDTWLAMDSAAGLPCHEFAAKSSDIWYLSSLTVSPDCQGTGVGSKLLSWIENYIKEQAGRTLTFFTNSQSNIDFYKKRGYEVFDYREFRQAESVMGSWSVKKDLEIA